MDRNGYNESIFNTESGKCFICGANTETARHEVFPGANRQVSKKYGFWYNTCPRCHDMWHLKDPVIRRETQEMAQTLFERTHTREEFMQIIGRSYL